MVHCDLGRLVIQSGGQLVQGLSERPALLAICGRGVGADELKDIRAVARTDPSPRQDDDAEFGAAFARRLPSGRTPAAAFRASLGIDLAAASR